VYGLNDSISADDKVIMACRLVAAAAHASPDTASRASMQESMTKK